MSEAAPIPDISRAERAASLLATEMDEAGIGPASSVLAVMLCGACAFADLYATQPLLPLFVHLFHASKSAVGLTVSASTLGVALSAPIVSAYDLLPENRTHLTTKLYVGEGAENVEEQA